MCQVVPSNDLVLDVAKQVLENLVLLIFNFHRLAAQEVLDFGQKPDPSINFPNLLRPVMLSQNAQKEVVHNSQVVTVFTQLQNRSDSEQLVVKVSRPLHNHIGGYFLPKRLQVNDQLNVWLVLSSVLVRNQASGVAGG